MKKLTYLLILLTFLTAFYGCNKEDDTVSPQFGPPSAPQTLSSSSGNGRVTLNWLQPANIGGAFAFITGYNIYRSTSPGGNTILITVSGETLAYTDSTVVNGISYYYSVTASNEAGESPKSNEVNASPNTPPGAPINPSATGQSGAILVAWEPPTGSAGTIISYRIYRGTGVGNLSLLREVNFTEENFLDNSVTIGTTYYYAISAVSGVGEGPRSAVVSGVATP